MKTFQPLHGRIPAQPNVTAQVCTPSYAFSPYYSHIAAAPIP